MKFCKNCKYFSGGFMCSHPNNGINLIDGEGKPEFCTTNRNSTRYCGPDGNWFEQKEKEKPKKWWQIWSEK